MGERQTPERDDRSCDADYTRSAHESPIPKKVRDELMSIKSVEGVGLADAGRLRVYVSAATVRSRLPDRIGGFQVDAQVTGGIRLLTSEGF